MAGLAGGVGLLRPVAVTAAMLVMVSLPRVVRRLKEDVDHLQMLFPLVLEGLSLGPPPLPPGGPGCDPSPLPPGGPGCDERGEEK